MLPSCQFTRKITSRIGGRLSDAYAEAGFESAIADIGLIEDPTIFGIESKLVYAYVSASRRFGETWELGGYYSYSKENQNPISFNFVNPTLKQSDYAVSAKYAVNYN
ncbi:MAG: hypothetical protein J6386_01385 [Candidatus Synoicihabitans palmerolidicus]|nr:hypothetical protein [Candidatus Synoicihabitans palmerolidicus]